MISRFVVCIMSCALMLWASGGHAQNIGSWPKLRMGMTQADLAKTYPEFKPFYIWGRGDEFGLAATSFAGCAVNLTINFEDGRVANVMLERRVSSGDPCREAIRAELNKRYGRRSPYREYVVRGTVMERQTAWHSGGATITFTELGGRSFVTYDSAASTARRNAVLRKYGVFDRS